MIDKVQLAIRQLAQQWQVEGLQTTNEKRRLELERQIFALEVLCVRLGFETLEVDLELARVALDGGRGVA